MILGCTVQIILIVGEIRVVLIVGVGIRAVLVVVIERIRMAVQITVTTNSYVCRKTVKNAKTCGLARHQDWSLRMSVPIYWRGVDLG